MKIAIVNQPLANRGDEAAHKAFVRALAKALPDAQIDVLFISAKQELVDAMNVNESNVRYIVLPPPYRLIYRIEKYSLLLKNPRFALLHPSLRRFYKCLKAYDKVICAPGGICMGGFMDWGHIWQLLIAKQLKTPVFYWGRSIGPFSDEHYQHKVFKKYSYELLHYFSYISLRDSKSVAIAGEAGTSVDEVVDSAFLETPAAQIPEQIASELSGSEYIVFVPNELTWHYRYKDIPQQHIDDFYLRIIAAITKIYPQDKIVMLPQTYKDWINDFGYFERLKTLAKSSNIIVVDENESSDIQQSIIAKARLVVGARYHSIVFAINNNIPFISLSYEHKMKGLLEKLGFTKNMVEIQDIFDDGAGSEINVAVNRCCVLITGNLSIPDCSEAKRIVQTGFENMIKELNLQ